MHRCPVPLCKTQFDPSATQNRFMCRNHWRLLTPERQAQLQRGEIALAIAAVEAWDRDRVYRGRNFQPALAGGRR